MRLLIVSFVLLFSYIEVSGIKLSLSLRQRTETQRHFTSKTFQDNEHSEIMSSTAGEGLVVKNYMKDISKAGLDAQRAGIPPVAVKSVIGGVLNSMRLTKMFEDRASDAINTAMNMSDPIEAAKVINKVFKDNLDLIFASGVRLHTAHGGALVVMGGSAFYKLQESIVSIQKGGIDGMNGINWAQQLCLTGIEAGGDAKVESLKAGRESLLINFYTIMDDLQKIATDALEGLRIAASSASNRLNHMSGIMDCLNTTMSTNDPLALDTISRLNSGSRSVLSVLTQKNVINAVNFIIQGLSSTIIDSFNANLIAENAFENAKNLARQDKDAAVAVLHKGIKEARNKMYDASSRAYMGMGAAAEITSKSVAEELVPAMIEVEQGEVTAYIQLDLAWQFFQFALQTEGQTIEQGFIAAKQILKAARQAMCTQFIDAAEFAFDVLKRA